MGSDSDQQQQDQAATPDQAAKPQAAGADGKPAAKAADGKSGKTGKVRKPAGPPPVVVWSLMSITLIFFGVMCYVQCKRWFAEKPKPPEAEITNINQIIKDSISRANEKADAAIKSKAPVAERKALLQAAKVQILSVKEDLTKFEAEARNHVQWTQELIDYQMQIFGVPVLNQKMKVINEELAKIAIEGPSSEAPPGDATKPPTPAAAEPGPVAPPTAEPKLPAPAPAAVEPAPVAPPVAEPKPAAPAAVEPGAVVPPTAEPKPAEPAVIEPKKPAEAP
jgi:hypothetical protein